MMTAESLISQRVRTGTPHNSRMDLEGSGCHGPGDELSRTTDAPPGSARAAAARHAGHARVVGPLPNSVSGTAILRISAACIIAIMLILTAGQAGAQSWFSDAENLAAMVWDGLLAPDSLVALIDHDLFLIRDHTPAVLNIHYACAQGIHGEVDLCMDSTAKVMFLDGQHGEMDSLHASLGQPTIRNYFGCWLGLSFARPYKAAALIELYREITGVRSAYPPSPCYGDGDRLELLDDGTYRFTHRWGEDCPSGCSYEHVWVFRVSGGSVELLLEYGDEVFTRRLSWGALKGLYR